MKNIRKDFFGNQVLTDINLELREGEVLGLVGENGAGKSTLMKILFGARDIAETGGYGGEIVLDGESVHFESPFDAIAKGIGMVHQEFSLIPGFTAAENIVLNREPKKHNVLSEIFSDRMDTLDRNEMKSIAAQSIEKMGVSIDQAMVINDMPVGHKQFTEIARELSKDQLKLLILDEPTAVLTEKEADALLESIRGMSKNGIAVIFITHRLQEILSVCDTV
ncbi:MAG: sugar ABC transporter ATP-binding protein, partial [Butyrivibrio sp.]|nr:sugar ABC transporter ATP-binding protein [Butyrivibrio sp.]